MRRIGIPTGKMHAVYESSTRSAENPKHLDSAETLCGRRVAGRLGHCVAHAIDCKNCQRVMRARGMGV